ncbi:putative PurR-regulated permease PerM [Microbacterium sp. AK009]|uniref:AI-2E family transporter n=1 Tax=Microbacterium sp. AK009 TaxID=2723068 RepID=UPI0015CED0BD|nr:AI-2E family transporter [Microbacterium sp. AK009]NYF15707.1 putative PurR-regulated permease PerM [Microbacterium sp. AK009]
MGLFRRAPRPHGFDPRASDSAEKAASSAAKAAKAPVAIGLWADGLGKVATRALQILIVIGIATLAVLGLQQVTVVWIPIIIALIFACAFAPLMSWLRRGGVPSVLATLITLLAVVVVLGLAGWLIVWAVRNQWDDLYSQAEAGFQELLAWINTLPFAPSDNQIEQWRDQIIDFITSAQFGTGAIAGVSALANFVTGLVLMIVVLFFFLKDGPWLWEFLLRPFRGENEARARRIGDKTVVTLGSYVRGTAAVAFVDAVGIGIGLVILQVPLALPLAVLVFLLAFIPIVGATVAGILAALVALVANGWVNALFVVGVVVLVNQLEGNFLQPVLMGRTLKLHAFVILIALTVGTVLGGILGAVLAVPITAVVWGIIKVWNGPNEPARWAQKKAVEPAG